MNRKIRIFAFLMSLALIVSLFAGCGDKKGNDDKKGSSGSSSTSSKKDSAVRDLGGRKITYYTYWEEPAKGSTAQANAYWKTKTQVEKDFNCTFEFKYVTGEWFSTLASSIMAGKPNCDVFTAPLSNLYSSVSNGLLVDLKTLDEFDFSESKWHTATMEKGTVGSSVYAMLASNGETHKVLLYNKDLMNKYKQPDLYEQQKAGTLTLDSFFSTIEAILPGAKADGNDVIAPNTYTFNFYNLLANCYGVNIIAREKGTLNFINQINDTKVVDAYNKAQELLGKGALMNTAGKDWKYPYNQFIAEKSVFYMGGSDMGGIFKAANFDVGMCLMPTADGKYLIDQSDAIWCGIPKGVDKADDIAIIFDRMVDVIFTTDYKMRFQDYLTDDAMELMATISTESQKGNYNADYFPMLELWHTSVGDNLLSMVDGTMTPAQTVQTIDPVIAAAIKNTLQQ